MQSWAGHQTGHNCNAWKGISITQLCSGVLSLGRFDIWGWICLMRSCLLHCRMLNSNADIYPLDSSSISTPRCNGQKCVQTWPNVPWEGKSQLLITTDIALVCMWLCKTGPQTPIQGPSNLLALLYMPWSNYQCMAPLQARCPDRSLKKSSLVFDVQASHLGILLRMEILIWKVWGEM
jgi:hypothetical protein